MLFQTEEAGAKSWPLLDAFLRTEADQYLAMLRLNRCFTPLLTMSASLLKLPS
jgi:hypothetical protein